MYFGHHITPLTSHIRRNLLQLVLPHMVDHTFMAFHVPLQTLSTPWAIFVPLMFPRSSLKTCNNFHTRLLIPFSRIYVDLTLKPAYIRMCTKGQMILEFSFMWNQVTCLLAFHIPWDHSLEIAQIRPSITPLKHYITNPLDTLKGEELKSKKTIVHCCRSLYLSLHPFVPWSTFVFFPSFPFACEFAIERWRIEVVEAQVGDSGSPIHRHADRGCLYCNLCFILIEIYFCVQ